MNYYNEIKENLIKSEIYDRTKDRHKVSIYFETGKLLNQLGVGFTYVGNEYKIKVGNTYNYTDLLLYNIKYKCYAVVELKATELKKEHTGQIMTYMN